MEKNISVMNDLHKINISNVLNPSAPMESNLVQDIPQTPPQPSQPAVSKQLSEAMLRRTNDFRLSRRDLAVRIAESLAGIDWDDAEGPVLVVRGADLMDGTPILDVKPYIPYADSRPEARGGFTDSVAPRRVRCVIPDELLQKVPEDRRAALTGVLEQDPRPTYQDDPGRIYGFGFAGLEVRLSVSDGVLTVTEIL